MFVSIRAKGATLMLLSACGGNAESPARAVELPSAERLHGEWRHDYLTAGALSLNTRLRFSDDGTFTLDTTSMNSFTVPATTNHYQGSYHGSDRGTVRYEWETETGQSQAERSLTFVEGRAFEHRCCTKRETTELWWSHRGYLATSPTQTTFHREAAQRQLDADGSLGSSLETKVDLTFSQAPAELVGRNDGTLALAVQIEVVSPEGAESRSFRRTFPVQVQADGDGMRVVSLPGWDTAEGSPLTEWPYRATALWAELLAKEADTTDWSDSAREELANAFEPYLAFDEARPNVLFHHIDWNSLDITGYARVPD
jgi:hypothetical protein